MRKRRGAIHSDDEEEFIKLSILSQKTLGIFYNDSPEPKPAPNKQEAWANFDYNKEDRMRIEELEEEQEESGKRSIINVMVIHEKSLQRMVRYSISKVLGLPESDADSSSYLQLMMKEIEGKDKVVKFWLANTEYKPMLESYYKMSDVYFVIATLDSKEDIGKQKQIIKMIKGERQFDFHQILMSEEGDPEKMEEFEELLESIVQ